MFKNLTIILFIVFCTTYLWLNFDLVYYNFASILDLAGDGERLVSSGEAHLFPISQEKKKRGDSKLTQGASDIPAIIPSLSSFNLSVPTLNIRVPIVFEPTTVEKRIYAALEKGAVHYAKTPQPGQPGTSIILGHSSSYPWYQGKFGSVFANLSKLNEGDIINIEKEGRLLSYRVTKSIIFSPNASDDYALRELEATDGSSLVLMTCWPTGTNAKRVAVRADLII